MNLFQFDEKVFSILYGLANKNQFFDWLFIFLASYLIYILLALFIWFLLKEKDWRRRFYFGALAIVSVLLSRGIITDLIRYFYDKPRPFALLDIESLISHSATNSFPSGHLTFLVPIALTLWLMNRRLGLWFLVGALLIGVGRIGVGIHWPSDILGGFAIGAISFGIIYYLLRLKGLPQNLPEVSLKEPRRRRFSLRRSSP